MGFVREVQLRPTSFRRNHCRGVRRRPSLAASSAVVLRRSSDCGLPMGSEDVPPGWSPPAPAPAPAPTTIEMGQMTCGSCQGLLSYPWGSKHVKCGVCDIVNLVLEAHEVGNVQCDDCSALLIYPFGAPAVKCSICHSVTNIGERNRRPPLSVLQGPPPLSQTLIIENSV